MKSGRRQRPSTSRSLSHRTRRSLFPVRSKSGWTRHHRLFLAAFSIVYLIGASSIAAHRFLWADEVLTAYVNRLDLSQLWPALASGVDLEPPLFHLITRGFTSIFGPTPLALRMPAVLGGWLLCISLYLFVAHRFGRLYGYIAMLIPFVTGAAAYTYEARCYGIALGFSGIALICWQRATERRHRRWYLVGLALSLAAAIACQYYMSLVFAAISSGEAVRSLSHKHIDGPVWLALIAGLLPLPFHLPLIRAAMTFTGGAWSVATAAHLISSYREFLDRSVLPGLVIVTCVAVYSLTGRRAVTRIESGAEQIPPPWEMAATMALAGSLIGAFILAKLTNGAFSLRYGLCLVLGFAILPIPAIRYADTSRPLASVITFLVLLASFGAQYVFRHNDAYHTPRLLQTADKSSMIVVENPLDFLELLYNAPPQLAGRLQYLISRKDSIRYTGTDDDERGLLLLRRYFKLPLQPADSFLKERHEFLIWRGGKQRWLSQRLLADGIPVRLVGVSPEGPLFAAATRPGSF